VCSVFFLLWCRSRFEWNKRLRRRRATWLRGGHRRVDSFWCNKRSKRATVDAISSRAVYIIYSLTSVYTAYEITLLKCVVYVYTLSLSCRRVFLICLHVWNSSARRSPAYTWYHTTFSIYPDLLASFDFTPVAFFSPRYIFIYFSIHRGRRRRRRAILFIGEEKISDSEWPCEKKNGPGININTRIG
jgi:hypothetical protein